MPVLYKVGQWTVAPGPEAGLEPEVEGLENVPETGGAILAGNHLSVADEIFLAR